MPPNPPSSASIDLASLKKKLFQLAESIKDEVQELADLNFDSPESIAKHNQRAAQKNPPTAVFDTGRQKTAAQNSAMASTDPVAPDQGRNERREPSYFCRVCGDQQVPSRNGVCRGCRETAERRPGDSRPAPGAAAAAAAADQARRDQAQRIEARTRRMAVPGEDPPDDPAVPGSALSTAQLGSIAEAVLRHFLPEQGQKYDLTRDGDPQSSFEDEADGVTKRVYTSAIGIGPKESAFGRSLPYVAAIFETAGDTGADFADAVKGLVKHCGDAIKDGFIGGGIGVLHKLVLAGPQKIEDHLRDRELEKLVEKHKEVALVAKTVQGRITATYRVQLSFWTRPAQGGQEALPFVLGSVQMTRTYKKTEGFFKDLFPQVVTYQAMPPSNQVFRILANELRPVDAAVKDMVASKSWQECRKADLLLRWEP